MYIVSFDTSKFKSKNRRDWEVQLMNDFAVAINKKEFICDTDLDLLNRLAFITGYAYSSKNEDKNQVWDNFYNDENNFIHLEDDKYGHQRVKCGMYGIAQGYVDFEKVLETLENESLVPIPFGRFYDLRQGSSNFFKGCFVVIEKVD